MSTYSRAGSCTLCLQCREGHHGHSQLHPFLFFPMIGPLCCRVWAALHPAQVKQAHAIAANFSLPSLITC